MKRVSFLALTASVVVSCEKPTEPVAPAWLELTSSSTQTTYSGDATVVRANVLGLASVVLGEAGPLEPTGGADESTLLEANVPGLLSAEVIHASTVAQGNRSQAEASVAQLALTVAGSSISAGFLMAEAEARCRDGVASTSGRSAIAELTFNEQSIVVTGEPNQTILLPNGRVVINEQTAGPGDIRVTALHVIVDGVADVAISSAHADITCPPTPPPPPPVCSDFVTGGGWITPSGAKANFAVAGGIKNGALWGHLTYADHGAGGPRVKGTGVTAYEVVEATTRRIKGVAEVNGESGFSYEVDVSDNGEPGRDDVFSLKLSSGYSAGGTPGGGNIQLHDRCS